MNGRADMWSMIVGQNSLGRAQVQLRNEEHLNTGSASTSPVASHCNRLTLKSNIQGLCTVTLLQHNCNLKIVCQMATFWRGLDLRDLTGLVSNTSILQAAIWADQSCGTERRLATLNTISHHEDRILTLFIFALSNPHMPVCFYAGSF